MKIKYVLAAALVTPLMIGPSTAQQYVGGPKSSIPPSTQSYIYAQGVDIYAQGGDVYAQGGDVYARGVRADRPHAYRAGPKPVVPRGY